MAGDVLAHKGVQLVLLCFMWYTISSTNNVISKVVLTNFPYPLTVTMVHLLSITVYSGPVFALWGIRPYVEMNWNCYLKFIVPLAFGKFFTSVTSHVSLWKVPVSYAHTVKATMPLFTVILSKLILREDHSLKVYISLVPIIVGVMIATVTEISFDIIGLTSALLSTVGFAIQNIYTKKVIHDTQVHHFRLLHALAKLALIFFVPFWVLFDVRKIAYDESLFSRTDLVMLAFLLFVDGALNFAQNLVSFTVLNMVTPLTYAVCSATKRISVIVVSLLFLNNPVTPLNIFGMMTSVFGVFCYNKAKYDARHEEKAKSLLPITNEDKNPLLSNFVPTAPLHIIAHNSYANGGTNISKFQS